VTVNLNGLRDDGKSGEQDFVQVDIELIHGGSAGDTMNGNGGGHTFDGAPRARTPCSAPAATTA
jgi:hypothetical protein